MQKYSHTGWIFKAISKFCDLFSQYLGCYIGFTENGQQTGLWSLTRMSCCCKLLKSIIFLCKNTVFDEIKKKVHIKLRDYAASVTITVWRDLLSQEGSLRGKEVIHMKSYTQACTTYSQHNVQCRYNYYFFLQIISSQSLDRWKQDIDPW